MGRTVTARLPKLDFLRAVSAAVVIAYHYGFNAVPAGFGVMTFFVISGFLITFLLLKESERTGTVSLKNFYIRRSLRIFPAFYAYWMFAVLVKLVLKPPHLIWGQAISSLLYVGNYYQGLHGYPHSALSHTWSLGVEEQFYLIWPAVFLLFRNKLSTLIRGLLVLMPCLWLYRAVLHFHGVSYAYIYTSFETRIDAILAGCVLAMVLYKGVAPRAVQELRRSRYIPLVLGVLALSILGSRVLPDYKFVIGYALDPVLLAVLILQLTSMTGGRWMDSKPIAYLGQISYSTYLYQQFMLPVLRSRLPHSVSLIGCFVGIWAVAAVSYELVEKPFLRLRKRFEVIKVPDPAALAPAPEEVRAHAT